MNIINAIYNLVNNPVSDVVSYYSSKNRANAAGDALEEYVKDLFANTFDMQETERLEKINEVFSYLGNNSNPPDAMLRGGDAIETKKISGCIIITDDTTGFFVLLIGYLIISCK